jgi:hypothetical protein
LQRTSAEFGLTDGRMEYAKIISPAGDNKNKKAMMALKWLTCI